MLANNNEAIINKLAKNSVKTNKKQYAILFFTIILSAFMLFCVFTIGMTSFIQCYYSCHADMYDNTSSIL